MQDNQTIEALDHALEIFSKSAAAESSKLSGWEWASLVRSLSLSVLIFTGVALVLCTVLMWRLKAAPQLVIRVFGLLTIIGMSSWLVVVGYSSEQLTPIVGLFGAIAGYLLGKDTKPPEPPTSH